MDLYRVVKIGRVGVVLLLSFVFSCHKENFKGNDIRWERLNDFPFSGSLAYGSFVLNNERYFLYTGSSPNTILKYNAVTDAWSQVKTLDIPGSLSQGILSVLQEGNRIFFVGYSYSIGLMALFEYNFSTNTLAKLKELGLNQIIFDVFPYNGKLYITNVEEPSLSVYDIAQGTITRLSFSYKTLFYGNKPMYVQDSIYLVSGFHYHDYDYFYVYWSDKMYNLNLAQNSASERAFFPGSPRVYAFTVPLHDKGYIGCGLIDNDGFADDVYQFDPKVNYWRNMGRYPGESRYYFSIAFEGGDWAYIGKGAVYDSLTNSLRHSNEFFRFKVE